MRFPRQCAILIGGLGTRLGAIGARTPKPLLDCGGRPFLAWIMRDLSRFGIEEFVLLAGFKSDQAESFCAGIAANLPKPAKVRLSVEPLPAGTGGAIWHARHLFDEQFLLVNGDSWFDVNLARFLAGATCGTGVMGQVLLRRTADASRYGVVELAEGWISAFRERPQNSPNALMNTGIYLFARGICDFLSPKCSLEGDILPVLAARRLLRGEALDGYFIDIGMPADYARAQRELPRRLLRPAVFFDRDGVLNEDAGWVGARERFVWREGAREAVRLVNDAGFHAFIVSNQAGIARGLYTESDLSSLHEWMTDELHAAGATIDDWRFCPHHPEAPLASYRRDCAMRKPQPGMILSLAKAWRIDREVSLLIGDKGADLEAAARAGVAACLYDGREPLDRYLRKVSPNDWKRAGAREALAG